eukprot:5729520-Amphidinium_carterae.1
MTCRPFAGALDDEDRIWTIDNACPMRHNKDLGKKDSTSTAASGADQIYVLLSTSLHSHSPELAHT